MQLPNAASSWVFYNAPSQNPAAMFVKSPGHMGKPCIGGPGHVIASSHLGPASCASEEDPRWLQLPAIWSPPVSPAEASNVAQKKKPCPVQIPEPQNPGA